MRLLATWPGLASKLTVLLHQFFSRPGVSLFLPFPYVAFPGQCDAVDLIRLQPSFPWSLHSLLPPEMSWALALTRFHAFAAAFLLFTSATCYNTSNTTGLLNSQILNDPFPYFFPRAGAAPAQLFAMPLCDGFRLEEASIDDLQQALSSGKLTSVQLVTCYLQRAYQTADYIK